uniref:SH3 domain-containing protein n=1 Tax=Gelidibacter sp. TaxID=2018083 RepID=UPI00404B8B4D
MNKLTYILVSLIFLTCKGQNKELPEQRQTDSISLSKESDNKLEVIFSAYATAKKGLDYRKEPNLDAEIIGKINYGTKVDVVDNSNRSYFWVDDSERASLYGKLVGIKKDTNVVYVFDGYLYKSSIEIDKHIALNNGNLEVMYAEVLTVNSNQNLIIEKHIQTSNILADYTILKLETNNEIVYAHRIEHLLKEYYTLKKQQNKYPTYEYHTLFDESPSSEYKQVFTIKGNKILKISEEYSDEDEEKN